MRGFHHEIQQHSFFIVDGDRQQRRPSGVPPAEKIELSKLLDAGASMQEAHHQIGQLMASGVNASVANAARNCMQAVYQLHQGAGLLLHVNTNPNKSAGEELLAGPWGSVVAAAYRALDRAGVELNECESDLESSRLVVAGAKSWIASARAHLESFDRSRAYAAPFPITSLGFP